MIGLVDCDCFFASCEQKLNPALKNKPVCVIAGGSGGCVIARSREAKTLGVPMGEPCFKFAHRFHQVVFVPARHNLYEAESKNIMQVIHTFSPKVEAVSVDEAYVDFSGLEKLYHHDEVQIALDLRKAIQNKTNISVSIGLAPSKVLAKLASDKAKATGGLFVIDLQNLSRISETTAIDDVVGIGRNYRELLHEYAVYRVADFVQKSDGWLKQYMGVKGLELKYELMGKSMSPVNPVPKPPQSVQRTKSLIKPTSNESLLRQALCARIHEACHEVRENGAFIGMIGVLFRTKDFKIVFDKKQIPLQWAEEKNIIPVALNVFATLYHPHILYRSVGIVFEKLSYQASRQLSLFEETKPVNESLGTALDSLEKKYGKNIVKTGYF